MKPGLPAALGWLGLTLILLPFALICAALIVVIAVSYPLVGILLAGAGLMVGRAGVLGAEGRRMKPAHIHTRIVIVALFAVLVCLTWAGKADAGYYGPGRPFGEAELVALAQAEAYWGQQPALCTSSSLEVVTPGALGVDEETGADVAARATKPTGPTPCTMWVEEDVLGDPTSLCSIERHEYGHWLGFGHEDAELAQMPGCERGSHAANGGVYVSPNPKRIARRQSWELFREWRAGCQEEPVGSKARRRCFGAVRRYGARLRSIWG